MTVNSSSIFEGFSHYFRAQIADDEVSLSRVQHIRYRVYCEEFGYEEKDRFRDEREYDEYDERSIHCLITHISSSEPAACVRMVPANHKDSNDCLPVEKYCASALDRSFLDSPGFDRSTVCEISRLAVDRNFRRRPRETDSRFGATTDIGFSEDERRTFPLIAVACFLAATAITAHTGRTNVFAMMESFLPRLLSRAGIVFTKVGKDIEYHGTRGPYFITTQSALKGMNSQLKQLYAATEAQLFGPWSD